MLQISINFTSTEKPQEGVVKSGVGMVIRTLKK